MNYASTAENVNGLHICTASDKFPVLWSIGQVAFDFQ